MGVAGELVDEGDASLIQSSEWSYMRFAMIEWGRSDSRTKEMCWYWWIRWTSAMTEWRTQLLCIAEVLWHARPTCPEAVLGGGLY